MCLEKLKRIQPFFLAAWLRYNRKTETLCLAQTAFKLYFFRSADDANNRKIYGDLCYPLAQKVVSGYNATFLAYGARKSGKMACLFGSQKV